MSTELDTELECIEGPDDCEGAIEHRWLPDNLRSFPRCEKHFERRLESTERNLELMSDVPPSWFDPCHAGERWDEDY